MKTIYYIRFIWVLSR